jgi:hypothetical protein
VWVIDSFRMERSSALYHVQRIHSMTQGARVPIAWPHDGHTHDRGSGLSLSMQYKGFGANMMPSHAQNHGTNSNALEPALEEIRELFYTGKRYPHHQRQGEGCGPRRRAGYGTLKSSCYSLARSALQPGDASGPS